MFSFSGDAGLNKEIPFTSVRIRTYSNAPQRARMLHKLGLFICVFSRKPSRPVASDNKLFGESVNGLSRVERIWTKVISFLDVRGEIHDVGWVISRLQSSPKTLFLRPTTDRVYVESI